MPGIGSRALLHKTAAQVLELERLTGALAILPAHDRTAGARLAAAGGRVV